MRPSRLLLAAFTTLMLAQAAGLRYQDDRIRLDVPRGWSLGQASESNGALLAKDRYRIYLLTHQQHPSGIAGGRFGEIASYVAPWIHVQDPWACIGALDREASPAGASLVRVDLYFNPGRPYGRAPLECNQILRDRTQGTVWFGSYFTRACDSNSRDPECEGFFVAQRDDSLVFTVTLDREDGATLPKRGDPQLALVLREASEMAARLEFSKSATPRNGKELSRSALLPPQSD